MRESNARPLVPETVVLEKTRDEIKYAIQYCDDVTNSDISDYGLYFNFLEKHVRYVRNSALKSHCPPPPRVLQIFNPRRVGRSRISALPSGPRLIYKGSSF